MTPASIVNALRQQGFLVLDGAMATELEARGADIDDPLWSARVLLEQPALIEDVHYDYFAAGADLAITASYQASFAGFARRGLDRAQTIALLEQSVRLARAAGDRFLQTDAAENRIRPLVAASVGPYGAWLADGSEYRGDYGLTVQELADWHRPRFEVLAASGADLLACETIPALAEGEALARLLEEYEVPGWLSFSCRDESHLNHGEPMREAAALSQVTNAVVAVGVNCTAPLFIEGLLSAASAETDKPLLCYPNSGETWDAPGRRWLPGTARAGSAETVRLWLKAGARIVGGCCRTTPEDIREIREVLSLYGAEVGVRDDSEPCRSHQQSAVDGEIVFGKTAKRN
jgi:homocysteine S-methyltransferase